VDAEAHLAPAVLPADRPGEQPDDIPQPPGFVLAQHARRDAHAALVNSPRECHGPADARLAGGRGNVDQHAVAERVGAAVAADDLGSLEHGWFLKWEGPECEPPGPPCLSPRSLTLRLSAFVLTRPLVNVHVPVGRLLKDKPQFLALGAGRVN